MTRWVEAIHTDLSNDQWRTYIPVDLTEDTLDKYISSDAVFVPIKVNPDALDETTWVRVSRIVACRTVSERPTPAPSNMVSTIRSGVGTPGPWIG